MAQKMVAQYFRRSLSFPNHPPSCSSSSSSSARPKKKYAYHVRSVSLPCRSSSHPLISQLRDEVNRLKSSWAAGGNDSWTSAWLCEGLSQLKTVQESLHGLLHLPRTRDSLLLLSGRFIIDNFLDEFLRFLDAYGIFQTLMLTLKEQHSAAQLAVKRNNSDKMTLCSKNFKKLAKDFARLASNSLPSSPPLKFGPPPTPSLVETEEDELEDGSQIVQVIKDVIEVTASVSLVLFNAVSVSLGSPKPASCLRFSSRNINFIHDVQQQQMMQESIQEFEGIGLQSLRKKDEEELKWTSKRMQHLEDCINGIEIGSERVFRSLFNTRVSLLNLLTAL